MNFQPLVGAEPLKHRARRGMRDLGNLADVFDERVDDPELVRKKRRQLADADVTVLINRRSEHGSAMFAIPARVIGSAAEKRDPERGSTDDHAVGSANSTPFRGVKAAGA